LFERVSIHGQWSSSRLYFLAVTGSAVGLGNIWKFPYITGENGGGAFILVYLLSLVLIGLPLLIAETLIGRRGRQSPARSIRDLAYEAGGSGVWRVLGFVAMAAGLLILAYYSVIAGWILAYLARAVMGLFEGISTSSAETLYIQLVGDPERGLAWHTLFMLATILVVSQGVRTGLEEAAKILMPLLLLVLLILLGHAIAVGNIGAASRFIFQADFSALTTHGVLVAMGHAFFTLSLGVGAILVYGAYLPGEVSIARMSLSVVLADTVIAVLAGLVVFSTVLSTGLSIAEGPGLIFQALPVAFGQMAGGNGLFTLFLLLLILAALTSAVALLEPTVAWVVEKWEVTRLRATLIAGGSVWVLGCLCLLSFSSLNFEFEFAGHLRRNGFFDVLEVLTASLMLPLGGLILSLFVGWILLRSTLEDELNSAGFVFLIWYFTIRFITPAAIIAIFLKVIGVF